MQTVVGRLRIGSVFYVDGQRCKLIFKNRCRALVELRRRVMVRNRTFEAKEQWNISPGTLCEIRRRPGRERAHE